MRLLDLAFAKSDMLPMRHTYDRKNISFSLKGKNTSEDSKSFTLIDISNQGLIVRIRWLIVIFLFCLLGIYNSVYSDTVYLKNGTTYEGKILKEDDEKLALKTSIMTIVFYKKDIEAIQRFYPDKGSRLPEGKRFEVVDVLHQEEKGELDKKPLEVITPHRTDEQTLPKEKATSKKEFTPTTHYLKTAASYAVPRRGDIPNIFTDIELDKKSRHLVLNNDSGIYEIPLKEGKVTFKGAFSAPCAGVKLRAWAYTSGDMWVVDILSKSIQVNKNEVYRYPSEITNPTGLVYLDGFFYLTDASSSKIYKMQLNNKRAQIIRAYSLGVFRPYGVATDGKDLYVCSRRMVNRYDKEMNKKSIYHLGVSVDGITIEGNNLWAVGYDNNRLYRFKLP